MDHLWDSGLFTDNAPCKIALLYVYLPIICQEIDEFAKLWNAHRIRAQHSRTYLPTGKPLVMYHTPPEGIKDYGQIPPVELISELRKELEGYGKYHVICL